MANRIVMKAQKEPPLAHIILHIGQSKTGTTSLQSFMRDACDDFAQIGILYPKIDGRTGHKQSALIPYLLGRTTPALVRATGHDGAESFAYSTAAWNAVAAQVRETSPSTIVLSAEGFWSAGPNDPQIVRSKLADLGDDVTAVGYARSPAAGFLSRLNQNIRMTQGVKFGSQQRYRPTIEYYQAICQGAVHVRNFDRSTLVGGDIVKDFVTAYLPSALALVPASGVRANESVSNEALAILDQRRDLLRTAKDRWGRSLRGFGIRLIRTLDQNIEGARRPSLKPEIVDACVRLASDLHWLRDDFGLSFPDVDYSIAGGLTDHPMLTYRNVTDFCPIDAARLAEIDARWMAAFTQRQRRWLR